MAGSVPRIVRHAPAYVSSCRLRPLRNVLAVGWGSCAAGGEAQRAKTPAVLWAGGLAQRARYPTMLPHFPPHLPLAPDALKLFIRASVQPRVSAWSDSGGIRRVGGLTVLFMPLRGHASTRSGALCKAAPVAALIEARICIRPYYVNRQVA